MHPQLASIIYQQQLFKVYWQLILLQYYQLAVSAAPPREKKEKPNKSHSGTADTAIKNYYTFKKTVAL